MKIRMTFEGMYKALGLTPRWKYAAQVIEQHKAMNSDPAEFYRRTGQSTVCCVTALLKWKATGATHILCTGGFNRGGFLLHKKLLDMCRQLKWDPPRTNWEGTRNGDTTAIDECLVS